MIAGMPLNPQPDGTLALDYLCYAGTARLARDCLKQVNIPAA